MWLRERIGETAPARQPRGSWSGSRKPAPPNAGDGWGGSSARSSRADTEGTFLRPAPMRGYDTASRTARTARGGFGPGRIARICLINRSRKESRAAGEEGSSPRLAARQRQRSHAYRTSDRRTHHDTVRLRTGGQEAAGWRSDTTSHAARTQCGTPQRPFETGEAPGPPFAARARSSSRRVARPTQTLR